MLSEKCMRAIRKSVARIKDAFSRLREPERYDGSGMHSHKCDSCGWVWEHPNAMSGVRKAHRCRCGEYQFNWYRGSEAAKFIGTCKRVIPRCAGERVKDLGYIIAARAAKAAKLAAKLAK